MEAQHLCRGAEEIHRNSLWIAGFWTEKFGKLTLNTRFNYNLMIQNGILHVNR
jgi:hypothetical protein